MWALFSSLNLFSKYRRIDSYRGKENFFLFLGENPTVGLLLFTGGRWFFCIPSQNCPGRESCCYFLSSAVLMVTEVCPLLAVPKLPATGSCGCATSPTLLPAIQQNALYMGFFPLCRPVSHLDVLIFRLL